MRVFTLPLCNLGHLAILSPFFLALLLCATIGCGVRTPPTNIMCPNRLKQIGAGLHAYHDAYGCFPPAHTTDANGNANHSWRVLLLPFVGKKELAEQYDFSEPWDSERNLQLVKEIPDVFRCPLVSGAQGGRTPFLAIVGQDTAWSTDHSSKRDDFPDGMENTLIVIELPHKAVIWTKPEDILLSDLTATEPTGKIRRPSDINVLFVDGSVRSLCREALRGGMKNAVTRSEAGTVNPELLKEAQNH